MECTFFVLLICFFIILIFNNFIFLNGPMIKGNIYVDNYYSKNNGWNILDCGRFSDLMKEESNESKKKFFKKERSKCRRLKAMTGLEYFNSIFNVVISVFLIIGCLIDKRDFKECSSIFALIYGIPSFILYLIYTIYNGYIFRNDSPSFIDFKDLVGISTDVLILNNYPVEPISYSYPRNGIIKTNSNGAYASYNLETKKYDLFYIDNKKPENVYDLYAKYKDLGSSNYNFNDKLYYRKINNNNACFYNDIEKIVKGKITKINYINANGELDICKELYYFNDSNFSFISYNKNLYDRWLTSFIFGIIIICIYLVVFISSICFLSD